jgi:pseudaminic acid synthase
MPYRHYIPRHQGFGLLVGELNAYDKLKLQLENSAWSKAAQSCHTSLPERSEVIMKIKNRVIGENAPVYIIAEMSGNHAGSFERAKELIYAAKEANADCIKIQTYTPETITINCKNKYFQIDSGTWGGENLYHLYEKAFTPWEWQGDLKAEADRVGIDFFSSPFDNSAVDFLESIGIEFYKIASFELVHLPLLRYVASKGKPIIMSTGMSSLAEIDEAVRAIREAGNSELALLRCASAYPAITDEMNLATMKNMSEVFNVPVGLSDHSMGSVGAVTAVALGAKIIEKHFCINRNIENPDSSFSMEPAEFKQMVADIRQAEKAIGTVKYGSTNQEKANVIFRRSIFCVKDIKKGERITEENIRIIRPGYGAAPKYYYEMIGQVALMDISFGTPMQNSMIGNSEV